MDFLDLLKSCGSATSLRVVRAGIARSYRLYEGIKFVHSKKTECDRITSVILVDYYRNRSISSSAVLLSCLETIISFISLQNNNENREVADPGGGPEVEVMASTEEVDSAIINGGGGRLRELQARFEAMRRRNANFTCFLCCHVRTGTIVIGFWHMVSRGFEVILTL